MCKVSGDPAKPALPCDYFDMICGTSTGGCVTVGSPRRLLLTWHFSRLIAMMLGRMRMSVDACIDVYNDLASKAFSGKGEKGAKYDFRNLEAAVQEVVARQLLDKNAQLRDENNPCKT